MSDQSSTAPLSWLGSTYRLLVKAAETGGGVGVFDAVSPPRSGPPRHVHHAEDETICILSGELQFWVEGETFTRGAGEAVFVPRGTEHTFCVVSDHPSRQLVILTPGGFEGFFEEMAAGQCRIPEDMASVVSAGERFNISFTGPPLMAG